MEESIARSEYAEFVRRIREGDEQAAAELVRRYEPEIRLEVRGRLRLRNPALRRVFDSMDICQSVLASFFTRAAFGEFDLDEPTQVIRLLVGMARKKLRSRPVIISVEPGTSGGSATGMWNWEPPPRQTKPPADWSRAESCCRNSASVSSTKSVKLLTFAQKDPTGPPSPLSSGERQRLAANNWLARSLGSSKSWASTSSSIESIRDQLRRNWPIKTAQTPRATTSAPSPTGGYGCCFSPARSD